LANLADDTNVFYKPVLACLTAASIGITVYAVWISLYDISLMRAGREQFVWFENYVRFFQDSRGLLALWRTTIFTLLATTIEVALALAVVLFLDRHFAFKRIVRALLLIPIIMTPVVVGLTWRFIFDPASGLANYFLRITGIDTPVDWLGSPQVALFSILIADIWQWTPFALLLMLAAVDSTPTDPLDAARIDGAKEWQVTWYVLLPMLKRALAIVLLIRAIDSIKAFDLFYIMTRGGPALSTETLNYYGYVVAFTNFEISYSIAIALILTVFTNIALFTMYGVLFPAKETQT
jgi:multiple sugar transport system permease protein